MKATIRCAIAVMAMAVFLGGAAHAQQAARGFAPFTPAAFKAAADQGKMTLVFFHAPWCPVCKAQEPKVLAHLNRDAKDVVALKVDYDTNLDLRRQMNVQKQSTLILYSGATEIARLSYKSDDASIDELFSHVAMMKGGR
jgi:thiol-disulfide isomerase/thioredoxin